MEDSSQTPLRKSTYPTYEQPYSHDISALTNAHRNNVSGDDQSGSTTYRKDANESSGYKSMSSPQKSDSSPPARDADSNSDVNSHSPIHHMGQISHEPQAPAVSGGDNTDGHPTYRSKNSSSPNHRLPQDDMSPQTHDHIGQYDDRMPHSDRELMSATPTAAARMSKVNHRLPGENDDGKNDADVVGKLKYVDISI